MKIKSLLASLLVLAAGAQSPVLAQNDGASITAFSPQGHVENINQIHVRFSQDMVPLGDPEDRLNPFEMSCDLPGESRWVDSRNWAFEFDRRVPAGTHCSLTPRAGLTALDGTEVTQEKSYRFWTGGSKIHRLIPYNGHSSISQGQVFIAFLDAEPDRKSVLEKAHFRLEGIGEPVGINLLSGEEQKPLSIS